MFGTNAQKFRAVVAVLFLLTTARIEAAVFATYDAAQHDANGFQYGDFDFFAVDTSGGTLNIDITTDGDGVNGLFGGMGSDIVAEFDAATTQIEIAVTVDPLNVASDFRVVLTDSDSATTGDEFQFFFDLTGITPGVPTVLTQSLLDPGPVFNQAQFGLGIGDEIQNYGLRQIQIQSAFDVADRLKIDVESVKLVDPNDPLLIEFNTTTYDAQPGKFTFGTFGETGVLDASGSTFLINADPAGTGGPAGGFGFSGLNVDFEATDFQIEIEAKLLPSNTADIFNLLLGDNDGDDSGPELGSDDYLFTVDTADFNSSEFSTVTIPLGSGTENGIETTFGFTNGGDGLQNFDLSQMQIQAVADDLGVLGIEIARFSIVERPPGSPADFDDDGDVDGDDFLTWQRGFGIGASKAEGDANDDTMVNGADLAIWQTEYDAASAVAASAAAVPEPATCGLLLCATVFVLGRRTSGCL